MAIPHPSWSKEDIATWVRTELLRGRPEADIAIDIMRASWSKYDADAVTGDVVQDLNSEARNVPFLSRHLEGLNHWFANASTVTKAVIGALISGLIGFIAAPFGITCWHFLLIGDCFETGSKANLISSVFILAVVGTFFVPGFFSTEKDD